MSNMLVHSGTELSMESAVEFHHFVVACHSLDSKIPQLNNKLHFHLVPPSQVQVIPDELHKS